jgi:hypothetical protein
MLTTEEKEFLEFWEKNRLRQKKTFYQILVGLPIGALFGFTLLINFLAGRFWYKRADSVAVSQFNPVLIIVAVLLIIVFIAIFNRKHRWDMNEQRYLELRAKQDETRSEKSEE